MLLNASLLFYFSSTNSRPTRPHTAINQDKLNVGWRLVNCKRQSQIVRPGGGERSTKTEESWRVRFVAVDGPMQCASEPACASGEHVVFWSERSLRTLRALLLSFQFSSTPLSVTLCPEKAELHHKLFRRKIWARLSFISLFCLVLRHRADEVRIALMQNDVTVTWRGNEVVDERKFS